MVRNSRVYYKRYLQEAIGHLEDAQERLGSAFLLIGENEHEEHKQVLAAFGVQMEAMADNLRQYEASM